jgi:hypothetical protein
MNSLFTTVCIKKSIAFQIQINDSLIISCFELMIRDENMSYNFILILLN